MPGNAGRAFSIRVPIDYFKEVEKRLRYRFWDKERQWSNKAAGWADGGPNRAICPMRHERIAWSGPPHDAIRAFVCLDCHAAASEPEIRARGFTFEEVPDWEIHRIMDEDLKRIYQQGNPTRFYIPST